MIKTELYFGMSKKAGGSVTDADFQNFVDTYVTPRFPEGLTIIDAKGQWSGTRGLVRERSKVLILVHDGHPIYRPIILRIRDRYCELHHQESVMQLDTPVTASF